MDLAKFQGEAAAQWRTNYPITQCFPRKPDAISLIRTRAAERRIAYDSDISSRSYREYLLTFDNTDKMYR